LCDAWRALAEALDLLKRAGSPQVALASALMVEVKAEARG
jgi:hypothetical protein